MTKNVEGKLKVGDWIKRPEHESAAKYINVTKRNVRRLNDDLEEYGDCGFDKIKEEEIKKAENYLQELINLQEGDYIRFPGGSIDKISKLPKIKNSFDVESYILKYIETEREGKLEYTLCPGQKVSKEEAKKHFMQQKKAYQKIVSIFEEQLKNL